MEPLKNQFNSEFTNALADVSVRHASHFDRDKLHQLSSSRKDWKALELKERMRIYSEALNSVLGGNYEDKLDIICKVAPSFSGLQGMIFPGFVELFGLNNEAASLKALKYLTEFSTSEFAIRPFILRNDAIIESHILAWSRDKNYHVRRLASEGVRPRLPWAHQLPFLIKDPTRILPIINNLQKDNVLYVKKSVANNLNDIGKDHPNVLLSTVKSWDFKNEHSRWIAKHACRTLLKSGNSESLEIFGFRKPRKIKCEITSDTTEFNLGKVYHLGLIVESKHSDKQDVRIEYTVHYPRTNGKYYEKVFQIREGVLEDGAVNSFKIKLDLEQKSTRKLYAGEYKVEVKINGSVLAQLPFSVVS